MLDAPHRAFVVVGGALGVLFIGAVTPPPVHGQHALEVGLGWQNTGATPAMTWEPAIQGSRKDVPVFVGWRFTTGGRVYYASALAAFE